ncbi:MAG TPA: LytTR family DNA-binding domain-containing protein [Phnomibacter sp.]|nr:LytTR family DNA-binding domain-containing protein [Phnomibacter sp.]
MIRAIIIDDEQHCIQALKNDLQQHCADVEIVAECPSAKEGLLAIKNLDPQLVFLDVAMPWMNGFEMLELLPAIHFALIFTTAHDEYAALAFRKSAIDYLLKPVASEDLKEAVAKAKQKLEGNTGAQQISNLISNYRKPEQQKIAFPCRDGYEFIYPSHIVCCEAEGAYTKVYLSDARSLLISRSLGDIGELLPEDLFARVHHSSIVNLKYVTHFLRTDGGYVQMSNGMKLMVSRSKKDGLMEKLGLR